MEVVVRVTVRRDFSITSPQVQVPRSSVPAQPGYHVCTGVGPELMEAARDAVRTMIVHLGEHHGLDREEAYAVTSVACDLRIHELVDAPNWVVGVCLPDNIFS
jgi:formamidase